VFPQGQLSPDRLRDLVLELLADRSRLDTMAQRARALAVPDSAAQLAQLMTAAIDRAARRP
jgi:UDP-N-acetylglucosamine:LPS N-acetylglucosamine transferase